ncbi:MAG: hypothetical protein JRN68_06250 [Nitrososphaerota archaeon]|jgi:hypothetical protein|nr:hypothetical protein [Nitrososphaerota archaeon]
MDATRKPTGRMIGALKHFKIPDSEIDNMNFDQARAKLDELTSKARARCARKPNASPSNPSSPENGPAPDLDDDHEEEIVAGIIRVRVTLAKQIIGDELGVHGTTLNPGSVVLREIPRQIGSEQQIITIQRNKEMNLSRFTGFR